MLQCLDDHIITPQVVFCAVFCYMERPGTQKNSCNAKDGSPFGPFWNTFKIDFDASEFYGSIGYNADNPRVAAEWNKRLVSCTLFDLLLNKIAM